MTGPQVYLTLPSLSFYPEPLPAAVPPPVGERSFRSPFGIDLQLYNFALKPEIPVIFASSYIIIVFVLNAYNRRREWKPWWIARQRLFQWFVVAHNTFLTVYSTATFLAMLRAIVHTWPGLDNDAGLAGVADALCKMHGPRGIGDAATFNTTINIWEVKNTIIKLGYNGNPDPTDVGRLWNEGLAFWGWMFYVSKFYETLDTFIILAKGKRSATLQTYHHAGAMLCMWAGIRFMSPPIWMFVFVNSFIHALMYTYFTLSALGFKVPQVLKRTLTSIQIAQFVWGASYAAAHLFVQYDAPIATPYQVASAVKAAASSVSSVASAASYTASKVIESPASYGSILPLVKKLLLRAAGEEGIAERVTDRGGHFTSPDIGEKIEQFEESLKTIYETRWRTEWTKVDCIDTTGAAFAIFLNLTYLFPLTFLFGRFFVKAYTRRGKPQSIAEGARGAVQAGKDAGKKTEDYIDDAGVKTEDELLGASDSFREQLRKDVQAVRSGTFERQVKSTAQNVKEQGRKLVSESSSSQFSSQTRSSESTFSSESVQVTSTSRFTAADQSVDKQEQNLRTSQSTRPGIEDPFVDDTDAMGRSGAIVTSESQEEESDGGGLLPATPVSK